MINTSALTPCRRCARPTVAAVADGMTVRVDLAVLTRDEQTAALINREQTFTAFPDGVGGLELAFRVARHITFDADKWALIEHNCAVPRRVDPELAVYFVPEKSGEQCLF